MSNKSWKAKALRNGSTPASKPITAALVRSRIQTDIRLELMQQSAIMEQLRKSHHGDVPVPLLWEQRAIRLGGAA